MTTVSTDATTNNPDNTEAAPAKGCTCNPCNCGENCTCGT
jgi:hypothetical protein